MFNAKTTALLLSIATSACLAKPLAQDDDKGIKRYKYIEYCEIGDSWASGVAWKTITGQDNSWDKNKDNCLRINHASAVQLLGDDSWYDTDNYRPRLNFKACSGARFIDMQNQMATCDDGTNQIKKPRFAVMTAGGNNMEFFNIAMNCIYQLDKDHDYGPEFKDDSDLNNCKGECCKSLKASSDYIYRSNWQPNSLQYDTWKTVVDVLDKPAAKQDDKFKLYVTGYAQFWSTADGSDWCNGESFGANPNGHQPKLSLELRKQMNELLQVINSKMGAIIAALIPANKAGFIDIDPRFETHRFCEPGSSHRQQYYDDNVYFWNLSPPFATPNDLPEDANLKDIMGGGGGPVDPASGGTGDLNNGYKMRPFHPKLGGHTEIKKAVIQALKDDKVDGVKP